MNPEIWDRIVLGIGIGFALFLVGSVLYDVHALFTGEVGLPSNAYPVLLGLAFVAGVIMAGHLPRFLRGRKKN